MAYEDGVFATFEDDSVQNEKKTQKAGYPVFDEPRTFIKIVIPNSIDDVYRPATDADIKRFPKSYEAYQRGVAEADDGFPVEQWPQLTTAEVKLLRACNVKTVEQLAAVADSGLHRLGPGGAGLKQRAVKFLDGLNETDKLRDRIKELERQIEGLQAKPAAKKKPKRLKVSSG